MAPVRVWKGRGFGLAMLFLLIFGTCSQPDWTIFAQHHDSKELVRLIEEVLSTPPLQVNDPRVMVGKLAERNPRALLEAFLDYGRQPGLVHYGRFELALPEWGKYLGGVFRPLLLDYLKLSADGELVRQEGDLRQGMSRAAVAYYFLRVIDAFDEFPWAKNGAHDPKVPRPRIEAYPQILLTKGINPPAATVEYLFSEYPHEAWLYFSRAFPESTDISGKDYRWYSHVLEQAEWRLANGYTERVNLDEVHEVLSKFIQDRAWYSRRYVVHVLLKYPYFRTPELVKRLQEDKHPLVRDRAKFIKLDK